MKRLNKAFLYLWQWNTILGNERATLLSKKWRARSWCLYSGITFSGEQSFPPCLQPACNIVWAKTTQSFNLNLKSRYRLSAYVLEIWISYTNQIMFRAQQNAFDDVVGKFGTLAWEVYGASRALKYLSMEELLTLNSHSQGDWRESHLRELGVYYGCLRQGDDGG